MTHFIKTRHILLLKMLHDASVLKQEGGGVGMGAPSSVNLGIKSC